MRIVQTFWTAGKNPLEEEFFNTCYAGRSGRTEHGWAHADYVRWLSVLTQRGGILGKHSTATLNGVKHGVPHLPL